MEKTYDEESIKAIQEVYQKGYDAGYADGLKANLKNS